jgi:hypothetical protein
MSSRRAFTVDKQANGTEAGLGRVTEDAMGDERFGPAPAGTSQTSLPGERVHLRVGVGRRHRGHRQPVLDIITDGEIS